MDVQVLAAGEVPMEPRFLDDRADARKRRGALARHLATEHAHAAGGRLGEAEQQADQRRLACAVRAEETEGDTARDGEIDAVQRRTRAEPLAEPDGLDSEVVGGRGGHATTVRPRRRPRLGLRTQRGPPHRMICRPGLIRSDEMTARRRIRTYAQPDERRGGMR
jgi:hypothetical protein